MDIMLILLSVFLIQTQDFVQIPDAKGVVAKEVVDKETITLSPWRARSYWYSDLPSRFVRPLSN